MSRVRLLGSKRCAVYGKQLASQSWVASAEATLVQTVLQRHVEVKEQDEHQVLAVYLLPLLLKGGSFGAVALRRIVGKSDGVGTLLLALR